MTDFVATVQVEPGQTLWHADEVPLLTASALYRFEPVPDPDIGKSELRRLTTAEWRAGAAGRALNARELAAAEQACKEVGLPKLPESMTYRHWGEFLEAANRGAEQRGWLVTLPRLLDPNREERLSWVFAAEAHRDFLKQVLRDGAIQARVAGTLVPAPLDLIALNRLVMTRSQVAAFCALLALELADAVPGNVEPVFDAKRFHPDPVQHRMDLLKDFRALGGKRPKEGGNKGMHGALANLVRSTRIDKKTLGAKLDKAIEEERRRAAFPTIRTAKP
jgi:hypothetical protein